jgi:hypothetical protein
VINVYNFFHYDTDYCQQSKLLSVEMYMYDNCDIGWKLLAGGMATYIETSTLPFISSFGRNIMKGFATHGQGYACKEARM